MHQLPSAISRKEEALFELSYCVNELLNLKSELSERDIDQIDQEFRRLRVKTLEALPYPPSQVYPLIV